MALKHNLTTLPSEIRQQIFTEYFRADKGYVYDAQSDKLKIADEARTPIDLSLRYTCRSIADDTRKIPLSINPIRFLTAFREEWRSLAGCFNVAATVYYWFEQDFVLHLAKFITPEMYSQLDSKFPTFRPKLASQLALHRAKVESVLAARRAGSSEEEVQAQDSQFDSDPLGPGLCLSLKRCLRRYIDLPSESLPFSYRSFGSIHETRADFLPGREQAWDEKSEDVRAAVSYCLRLIAQQKPDEFSKYVYGAFPHWAGKYSTQDFLNPRLNYWEIPAREDVARMLEMLNIGDHVWQFPDMWFYHPNSFYERDEDEYPARHLFPDAYLDPLKLGKRFDVRGREKIAFSATAAAIRFLGRLPLEQRTQIRRLTLQENSKSVNVPSLHAQGLVPFFKENPMLRVERRVSVFGCIYDKNPSLRYTMREWSTTDHIPYPISPGRFNSSVSCWLLDALAVLVSGIPAESFTFVLDGGSHGDFCTELFQTYIHKAIAESKAYFICLESGIFESFRPEAFHEKEFHYTMDARFDGAVQHLVNQTSILRSDFNPGVPEDFELFVEESKALRGGDNYDRWIIRARDPWIEKPDDLHDDVMTIPEFEIQTWDDYLEAKGVKESEIEKEES
ncbi:hypothetical protein F53441_11930 [Fusarium austroafricanum]|uniref:Uncharacterized protein n=1 Tax=Fusarium austroafricanum TaxID=2364996 RepID=A0A8H4K308_9HYPO|nr:hypothetical protein F53441_11930 [Fusarium austroafricanum]